MEYSLNLEIEPFLRDYWQRQPVVIRHGFRDFVDPLDGDELAGLATLAEADSRLIRRQGSEWDVQQGPIRDFTGLGERDWTLLVQAVDHWIPDAAALLTPFRFLPNWRLDDLMVSFSAPGGGVGPHLDQYDVFIIQGQGCRHWRVGMPQPYREWTPHPELLQIEVFEPCIDVELLPGDLLYIPPGCPHNGYAIEPSLNYSVGFRAPSTRELFSSLADHLLDRSLAAERFGDPGRHAIRQCHGRVDAQDLDQLTGQMRALLAQPALIHAWLAQMLSEPTRELPFYEPEEPLTGVQLLTELKAGVELVWVGGVRALYAEESAKLFINGSPWEDAGPAQNVSWIADTLSFCHDNVATRPDTDYVAELLSEFYNRGWLERRD